MSPLIPIWWVLEVFREQPAYVNPRSWRWRSAHVSRACGPEVLLPFLQAEQQDTEYKQGLACRLVRGEMHDGRIYIA